MNYGSETGQFHILDPNFNNGLQHWAISYNGGVGNQIVLTAEAGPAPIPEPGTLLLFGTVLLGLGGYAKKKRSTEAQRLDRRTKTLCHGLLSKKIGM